MKQKRFNAIIAALLAVLLAVSPLCLVASAADAEEVYSQSISAVNGSRYENYLVIYTPAFGGYTNTNVYGYEVTVSGGYVVSVGGNNSAIPSDGFIVSGHGTMMSWLMSTVSVGMSCSYNESTVTFTRDNGSYVLLVNFARDDALEAKQNAYNGAYIYDESADARLLTAESDYASLSASSSVEALKALADEYGIIADLYREREISEYRGVWIEPSQTTYADVERYVKKCFDKGINLICLEGFFGCTTIYVPKSGSLFTQNPIFSSAGFDCLEAYITACHKYGMELHVWMPVFYGGSSGSSNWKLSPAYKMPSWCNVTQNGSTLYSDESVGMHFFNPALDEVQDFLAENYEYLIRNYDIDGFELDYIRYRDRTGTDDFGYDAVTVNNFKAAYPKYSSYNITYDTSACYWEDFVAFRQAQVTRFVKRMREIVDTVNAESVSGGSVKKTVVLSADVAADQSYGRKYLYSKASDWLENGWLDIIHPMAYGEGYESAMASFIAYAGGKALVTPGLGVFVSNFDAEDMRRQTKLMKDAGCSGIVYFQIAQYLSKNCGELLTETVFTDPASPPFLNSKTTSLALLQRISDRIAVAESRGIISSLTAERISAPVAAAAFGVESSGNAAYAYSASEGIASAFSSLPSGALKERLLADVLLLNIVSRTEAKAVIGSAYSCYPSCAAEEYGEAVIIGRGSALPDVKTFTERFAGSSLYINGAAVTGTSVPTGAELKIGDISVYVAVAGDINGDGKISGTDYLLLKRQVLGTFSAGGLCKCACDINGDGRVTSTDYLLLKRHVLGTFRIDK